MIRTTTMVGPERGVDINPPTHSDWYTETVVQSASYFNTSFSTSETASTSPINIESKRKTSHEERNLSESSKEKKRTCRGPSHQSSGGHSIAEQDDQRNRPFSPEFAMVNDEPQDSEDTLQTESMPSLFQSTLLSLPKDIRLKIYAYAVQLSPSDDPLIVTVTQTQEDPIYKDQRPPARKLAFTNPYQWAKFGRINFLEHIPQRETSPWNPTCLLLACRDLYTEALPLLYENFVFHPTISAGLIPLFLEGLSPFARSQIHSIHLQVPSRISNTPDESLYSDHPDLPLQPKPKARAFFNWKMMCAQIANFEASYPTLQLVTIGGDWETLRAPENRASLVLPLVKIKAAKGYVGPKLAYKPDHEGTHRWRWAPASYNEEFWNRHAEFQVMLEEAEHRIKILQDRRKQRQSERLARVEARMLQTQGRRDAHQASEDSASSSSSSTPSTPSRSSMASDLPPPYSQMESWCRWAEENLRRMELTMEESGEFIASPEKSKKLAAGIGADHTSTLNTEDVEKYMVIEADREWNWETWDGENWDMGKWDTGNCDRENRDGENGKRVSWDREDWDMVSMRSGASTPRARGGGATVGEREWCSKVSAVDEVEDDVLGVSGSGWEAKTGEGDDGEDWEHVDRGEGRISACGG